MNIWVRDWLDAPDNFQLTDWSCDDSVVKMAKKAQSDHTATMGGAGGIGPAYTYDATVEKPAGEKDMGGWTAAVYTPEQQQRLGVDEMGQKVPAKNEPLTLGIDPGFVKEQQEKQEEQEKKPLVGGMKSGSIGPAWTYDSSVEKPAGEKDMGGWTAAVYTTEQQQRLGVDEMGQKVQKPLTVGLDPDFVKAQEKNSASAVSAAADVQEQTSSS